MSRKHGGTYVVVGHCGSSAVMSWKHGGTSVVAGHCGASAVCLGSMAGPLLLQGIVGRVLYVSEAWRALCCCRALWVECCTCMSQKHGRPSVVAGHCGSSAVCLGSMAGLLLLQGIVGRVLYILEAWGALCCYLQGPLLSQSIVARVLYILEA